MKKDLIKFFKKFFNKIIKIHLLIKFFIKKNFFYENAIIKIFLIIYLK